MFDMTKIGKKISQLRKQNGLTQMGLADKLGISYQAVSNWERGATMPDISKLPCLAEIFGITIEEILCDERKGKIVEDIANGDESATENIKLRDLADLAPIMKDEQFKQSYKQADKDGEQIDFDTIIKMAPFLDDDILDDLVKNQSKYGFTSEQIIALAPFLSDSALEQAADSLSDGCDDARELAGLAPFLSEKALGRLARKLVHEDCSFGELAGIACHMDEKDLAAIVERRVDETKDISDLAALAPFMDERDLTRIVGNYLKNGGSFQSLTSLYPFLDMDDLFRKYFKK